MLRYLRYQSLRMQRRYPKSKKGLLPKMLNSDMVIWNADTVPRGMAIGMFWAFIPMPLQMIPASIFCWLIHGNLPIALVCVWLTNPITLPPILLLEYRIGEWVLQLLATTHIDEIVAEASTYAVIAGGLQRILAGGLVVSCTAMIVGYLATKLAFKFSDAKAGQQRHQRQARARQANN